MVATAPSPIVAIVGPTAAGKSELSLDVAQAVGGEIINTDAMQVYRGMDIGTAKQPVEQRRGIRHHLLDVLDVRETASVAHFQHLARQAIEMCRAHGVPAVLVGGSALYTRAVLDVFDFPGTDPEVRQRLDDEAVRIGPAAMHERLNAVDPVAAQQIDVSNQRRVVRALEAIELSGRPFAATLPGYHYIRQGTVQVGVHVPRPVLDQRIEERVDRMWEAGFVEEVRRLAAIGLREGRTANRALGYRQVLAYLDGTLTEDQARSETIIRTRRFARRQDSWYRRDPRITWVAWDDPDRLRLVLSTAQRASTPV